MTVKYLVLKSWICSVRWWELETIHDILNEEWGKLEEETTCIVKSNGFWNLKEKYMLKQSNQKSPWRRKDCFSLLCFILLTVKKTWTCLHAEGNEPIERKKKCSQPCYVRELLSVSSKVASSRTFVYSINIYCMPSLCMLLSSVPALSAF